MKRHPYYGTPAPTGSDLARLRLQVHHWLDARWKYGTETRDQSYRWLAQRMGLKLIECHAGMFDESDCRKAIEILKTGGDYAALAPQIEARQSRRSSANGV